MRTDGPKNLGWSGIVRSVVPPDLPGGAPPSQEDDAVLVAALWGYLEEYLEDMESRGGPARVFERYLAYDRDQALADRWPIGSLNELDGSIDADPPASVSDQVREVHRLHRVPVSSFSAIACQRLAAHWLAVETVVPRAIQILNVAHPLVAGTDEAALLLALLDLGPAWWGERLSWLADLCRALARRQHVDPSLSAAIDRFGAAFR